MQDKSITEILGPNILNHIFQFIENHYLFFVLLSCKTWRHAAREKIKLKLNMKTIMNVTSKNRHIGILKYLVEELDLKYSHYHHTEILMEEASVAGDWEIMAYLNAHGWEWDTYACAKGGHTKILRRLIEEEGCKFDYNIAANAAENGHLASLEYLHSYATRTNQIEHIQRETISAAAAREGHLACLQFLKSIKCEFGQSVCTAAASNGHLDCLKYARENGGMCTSIATKAAICNGYLDCVKYLIENECVWGYNPCFFAAQHGHLDILKYAHENGCIWERETCAAAAGEGHLECLKYAHENGCEWESFTCTAAAGEGYLECLKYAHENGCEWNERTCLEAAGGGHLDCLKYAHENGCPWDVQEVWEEVKYKKHAECMAYVQQFLKINVK